VIIDAEFDKENYSLISTTAIKRLKPLDCRIDFQTRSKRLKQSKVVIFLLKNNNYLLKNYTLRNVRTTTQINHQ
jgi:hypothetical protein